MSLGFVMLKLLRHSSYLEERCGLGRHSRTMAALMTVPRLLQGVPSAAHGGMTCSPSALVFLKHLHYYKYYINAIKSG